MKLALVMVIGGCALPLPLPRPPVWNASAGEVECPIGNQVIATTLTVLTGAVAVKALSEAPQPTTDWNGRPYVAHDAAAYGGLAALFGVVATVGWLAHARCGQLRTQVETLATVTDCAEVKRIEGDIASIDPAFPAVIARDPAVARCEPAGATGAPPPSDMVMPPPGDCVGRRRFEMLRAQQLDDPAERAEILTHLPSCDAKPSGS